VREHAREITGWSGGYSGERRDEQKSKGKRVEREIYS
jgi:hypothetical protein